MAAKRQTMQQLSREFGRARTKYLTQIATEYVRQIDPAVPELNGLQFFCESDQWVVTIAAVQIGEQWINADDASPIEGDVGGAAHPVVVVDQHPATAEFIEALSDAVPIADNELVVTLRPAFDYEYLEWDP